jgi:hypothetical protein
MVNFHPAPRRAARAILAVLAITVGGLLGGCGGGELAEARRAAQQATVVVSPAEAARQLMDLAEATQTSVAPFLFRHYAATGARRA